MRKLILFSGLVFFFSSCHQAGDMDDYNNCGLEGDAKRVDVRELNTEKNRYDFPDTSKIDHSVTLQSFLAQGNDRNRFNAGTAVEVTGYVSDVKVGGDESCNCHARNPEDRDTHIELVASENDGGSKQCVIVEVTPRMRAIMAKKGVDWSTDNIRRTLKNHYIKVKGWMLFDEEHLRQATNTAPDNPNDWRATCWEVHPVTSIELVNLPIP